MGGRRWYRGRGVAREHADGGGEIAALPIDADAKAVVIAKGEAEIDAAIRVDAVHLVRRASRGRESPCRRR